MAFGNLRQGSGIALRAGRATTRRLKRSVILAIIIIIIAAFILFVAISYLHNISTSNITPVNETGVSTKYSQEYEIPDHYHCVDHSSCPKGYYCPPPPTDTPFCTKIEADVIGNTTPKDDDEKSIKWKITYNNKDTIMSPTPIDPSGNRTRGVKAGVPSTITPRAWILLKGVQLFLILPTYLQLIV